MKLLISALVTLSSVNAMAFGSIVISGTDNIAVEIAWLGTEADESEIETSFANGGQDAVFHGQVCFKGSRKEAIYVLEDLQRREFMGDELRIQDIHFVGRDRISYEIYDGPNGYVSGEHVIYACK